MNLLVCEFLVALSVCLSIALIWSDLAVVSEAHSPATVDPIVEEHAPEALQTSAKPLQTSDAEAIPTSEEGPVEGSKLQEEETNLKTASISGASELSSHPALSVSMPKSQKAIVTLVETIISTN
jgi:hypothetical protein